MMRNLFKVLVVLLVINNSDTILYAQTLTPIQFNDRLITMHDSLFERGQRWGAQFNDAIKTKNFSALRPYRQNLELLVNEKIAAIKTMKDVNNSRSLRMAMLNFFTFEKNMVTKAFTPFENFNANTPQEEIQAAYRRISEFSKQEEAQIDKLFTVQDAYAKDNGFEIETAKPVDE